MKNPQPILYSFRRCPYAIRARMALRYSNVDVEHREVVLKNKPASMLSYSPKGTVPVLILDNGTVIDESRSIIEWALNTSDPDNWKLRGASVSATLVSDDVVKYKEIECLIDRNDNFFKQYLDQYKYFERYPEFSQETYRYKAEEFLKELENRLSHTPYLFSSHISIADISIFPFVRQFAFVDKVWFDQSEYNFLKRWLELFLQSDLFHAVMEKYQPFEE